MFLFNIRFCLQCMLYFFSDVSATPSTPRNKDRLQTFINTRFQIDCRIKTKTICSTAMWAVSELGRTSINIIQTNGQHVHRNEIRYFCFILKIRTCFLGGIQRKYFCWDTIHVFPNYVMLLLLMFPEREGWEKYGTYSHNIIPHISDPSLGM